MIKGTQNPVVGTDEIYQYIDPLDIFNSSNSTYVWNIWKKKQGKWTNITTKSPKMGQKVPFKFGEKVIGEEFKLEVFKATPKFGSDDFDAKSVGEILVIPTSSRIPKITKVELLYVDDTKGSTFSFMEKLRAKANCVGLFGKELVFTLWEDDAEKSGHNSKNLFINSKKGKVNSKGFAKVEFTLSKVLMHKAMQGEADTKQLEFYVTVEYFKKNKHATENVNINNPFPKPQKPVATKPQAPAKANGSPAASKPSSKKDEKGIWDRFTEGASEFGRQIYDHAEAKAKAMYDQLPTFVVSDVLSATKIEQVEPIKNEENKIGKCFCNRDFEIIEFNNIIHGLRDSETRVKKDSGYNLFGSNNCKLKEDDKTIEKLRGQINSIFKKYNINTCIRKIHFLAQIYHETDRLRTTLEYATNKNYKPYFGRGLMQLTWQSNYEVYQSYSGINCVEDYQKIAENLNYACESAGWYWKQGKVLSVGKNWTGPAKKDCPSYVAVHKPNYPKKKIEYTYNNKSAKYGTVDLSIIADDDIVDLISYLVNGGSNGLQERRNYVFTLKNIFKFPQDCVSKINKKQAVGTPSDSVTIRLVRKWETKKSTIGEFTIDNSEIKGFFLEEKGPDTTVSGIEQRVPIGTYNLAWHSGTKIKKGFLVYNDVVSKARAILIHTGNTATDTEGCIIAGSTKSVDFVGGSKIKLQEIFDYVDEKGIENAKLIITQSYE